MRKPLNHVLRAGLMASLVLSAMPSLAQSGSKPVDFFEEGSPLPPQTIPTPTPRPQQQGPQQQRPPSQPQGPQVQVPSAPTSGFAAQLKEAIDQGFGGSYQNCVSARNTDPANNKRECLPVVSIGTRTLRADRLRKFYSQRGYAPAWVDQSGAKLIAEALKDLLVNDSEMKGFSPEYYWFSEMDQREGRNDSRSLLEYELLLSSSYTEYASDIATGRTNPRQKNQNLRDIDLPKRQLSDADYAKLNQMVSSQNALYAGFVSQDDRKGSYFEPQSDSYLLIKRTLKNLYHSKQLGGWPAFRDYTVLKPGVVHPNVVAVRRRMVDLGLLPMEARRDVSDEYDEGLQRAVKRFQQVTYQQAVDGIVGNATYRILAVSLEERIQQTRANLERWRLMPRQFSGPDLGYRYLFVDMGRQELDVVEVDPSTGRARLADRMRVVVGRDLRGTPTMVDRVSSIIMRPYWYAPKSIIVKDIIPAYLKDSGYLRSSSTRVLNGQGSEIDPSGINWSQYSEANPPPYTFRQDPGEQNSLGLLRFSLNNAHSIYMHDTNHKEFFKYSIRYFSSGCIRLERPFDLANYLLDGQMYPDEITAVTSDQSIAARTVKLNNSIRVYIFGSSMTVYMDGVVAFVEDVYKQDKRLIDAMNGVRVNAEVAPPQAEN